MSWIVNKVKCDLCSFIWIAIYPKDCDKLECKTCGNISSYFEIKELKQ
jgi:hypothetical protein